MTRAAVLAFLMVVIATPVLADDDGWRLDLGAGIGTWILDADLGDYRWNVEPSPVVDAHASALRSRWALGLDLRTTATVQETGIPGVGAAPDVGLHMFEAHAAVRALSWYDIELWGRAHGGRMFVRYDPGTMLIDSPVGGTPIEVEFAPINEWTAGFGASLRREFFGNFAMAVRATHSVFALDTAHRKNGEIVEERQAFHNWSFGLSASLLLDL